MQELLEVDGKNKEKKRFPDNNKRSKEKEINDTDDVTRTVLSQLILVNEFLDNSEIEFHHISSPPVFLARTFTIGLNGEYHPKTTGLRSMSSECPDTETALYLPILMAL